ncbi:dihydropteroate synthase [Azospira sp. I13]|uniref:dihydropteroate synthase n=1 Tax=Azospira sp. I13 TaxID=1765050 RepID=UPI000D4791EC|nr:dihydropteroate synthase [Azospira sp. I13]GBG01205.1 dihydropteroate synthase [Azospira sp. I13]
MSFLRCGNYRLALDRPLVMGIVNLTPDSFSGDGLATDADRALAHARAQIAAGADILDLGAESTRPGAEPATAAQELARLLPVLDGLKDCGVPLSVDTYKPEVMVAVLAAGADMINDIAALQHPGALEAVAASSCGICLMHMQGEPRTMQQQPVYGDVVAEVRAFLAERVSAARAAGIAADRLVLDPGFGFGKHLDHNLELLRRLPETTVDGLPVLAGMSRKSMLGALTGQPVEARLGASIAAHLQAARLGARILRVHDVAAMRDALTVWQAVSPWNQ